jgi:hypothetical protein
MDDSILNRTKLAARILIGKQLPRNRPDPIPGITAEDVEEVRTFFPMEKFFIFGHARSGTTILARLIRLHPEVHCNYQAHFFTRVPLLQSMVADGEISAWLKRPSNRWNRGEDLSPVVLRAVADFILERDARQVGANIVGDKSPNNLMNGDAVNLMHRVYPDARLIFIVRDGRDAILSHRIQSFIDFPEHLSREDLNLRDSFVKDPKPFINGNRSLFTQKGIKQAAESWVKNVEETCYLGKELYRNRFHPMRFEDLLSQPWEIISETWDFLGADTRISGLEEKIQEELKHNPDAEWQREKAQDIVKPLQKGRAGAWKGLLTTRDKQVFFDIAGDTLMEWNYS